ncbi:MAG: hypothetical protein M3285_00275 [Actinomycetota bacterium]|nr:hypothetical protein [Actinomycetota bacterium]
MRKIILLGAAVAGLVLMNARVDARKTCTCMPQCWCQRPGLRHVRWVFPIGHKER